MPRKQRRSCRRSQNPPTTWCHDFYNTDRRHSSAAMLAPIDYETTIAQPTDAQEAA